MTNIVVGRYSDPSVTQSWQGWIEPEDLNWIAFIDSDGKPTFYLKRDPQTGAVLD